MNKLMVSGFKNILLLYNNMLSKEERLKLVKRRIRVVDVKPELPKKKLPKKKSPKKKLPKKKSKK